MEFDKGNKVAVDFINAEDIDITGVCTYVHGATARILRYDFMQQHVEYYLSADEIAEIEIAINRALQEPEPNDYCVMTYYIDRL